MGKNLLENAKYEPNLEKPIQIEYKRNKKTRKRNYYIGAFSKKKYTHSSMTSIRKIYVRYTSIIMILRY
jgi:hypothetical protein